MMKQQALFELKRNIYSDSQIREDLEFVIKKLELSHEEFNEIMNAPVRRHQEFDVEGSFFSHYPIFKPLRPMWNNIKNRRI